MKRRRRVTFRESFREMNEASKQVPNGGSGDADLYIGLPLSIWYWIAGVPDDGLGHGDDEPLWEERDRQIWSDDDGR